MRTSLRYPRLWAASFLSLSGRSVGASFLVLWAALLWAMPAHAQTPGTTVAGTTGSSGSGATQFDSPYGVFVDGTGNIYVADLANNRIQKFPPNSTGGTAGTTVAGGTGGSGATQFDSPYGVFVDGSGNLYVADLANHRIQKFPPNSTAGTAGTTVAGTGIAGAGATQLNQPIGVFVDGNGKLYVADVNNNRIQKFGVSATATASPPTCNGVASATVTATGGTSPYSYTWAAPAGITLSGGSTSVVQATAGAGVSGVQTLTVTVGDAASGTATATASLTFGSPPANPSLIASGTITCTRTATLTASSSSAGSFSYAFGGTGIIGTDAGAGTATVAGTGPYSVSITNLSTGCTSSTTITMVMSDTARPAVSIGTSGPALGCGITSVTLTANVSAGASFLWEDASSAPTRVISATGTYGLSATATNGCSATATPVNIGRNTSLQSDVTLVFSNSATVMGSGIATITVPNTPGQVFQVFGGSSYECSAVLDRTNGYEIRQITFSSTGVFPIR